MDGQRAAIYARFSTDLQSDRSIDDQIALCRDYAKKQGYRVIRTYDDKARSGTSIFGRDGLLRLMDDARAGAFDIVVVEALDRLSRDQEDLAGLYKRLTFAGVTIMAVHDGQADAVQVGIRGLVSTLFIADLKHKVRRGMAGVVRDGRNAGGKAYGYRPVLGRPGVLEIVEEEATVVRRIFEAVASGHTPREIAGALNREGIPAPRGSAWNASTINGNAARGNGILRNPIYMGRLVWNRVRMVRDPDTGKRVSRLNDPSEFKEAAVPHLAIIPPELFETVSGERARRREASASGDYTRAPKRILSGLLRCHVCGSGMSKTGGGVYAHVQCSRSKESGACSNTRKYRLDKIERAVIDGVKGQLAHPQLLAEYVRAYREERMADAAKAAHGRADIERRLSKVAGQIERLVGALARGVLPVETVEAQVAPLEVERKRLAAELGMQPIAPVVELHPQAVADYLRIASHLADHLDEIDAAEDRELVNSFRAMIDHVVVEGKERGRVEVVVIGRLTALLGIGAGDLGGLMVAEEGFEPPTHGL